MPSTNSHLKIFMLVTVKYNVEAILMIVYSLIDDMIIYISMEVKLAFSQVHVKYGAPVKIIKCLLVAL
jgi:hypothetical protein